MGDFDEKAMLAIAGLMEEADLDEGQDYKVVEGSHENFDDGDRHELRIKRGYTCLFETGFEKLGKALMKRDVLSKDGILDRLENIEKILLSANGKDDNERN
jgi:hypothetical protein